MTLRDSLRELAVSLISIKSPSGREREVQEFLEARLKAMGLEVMRQAVVGDRFNLIYKTDSPYLISCHVDTVPPAGIEVVERDGYIHGRGASDVKGALASLLTALQIHIQRGYRPQVNIALVVDEETNSALGSERAAEVMDHCDRCLVLEPTYGKLCTAQEGSLEFSVRVKGKDVHGAEYQRTENPVRALWKFIALVEEELARELNILQMKAGSGLYVTPKEAFALLELKLYENERASEVEEKIKTLASGVRSGCEISLVVEDAEDFTTFRGDGFVDLLEEIYRERLGREPERGIMPSWTDASNYHRAGMECVVFGEGSLMDSHTDRERISLAELESMTEFFLGVLERLR